MIGLRERLTGMVPHIWGLKAQAGKGSKAARAVGAGWRPDLPGGVRKQARSGPTSGRLSRRCLRVSGLPHLLSQEPLPFQTHSGDNAAPGGLGVITNRFHIQIQLVEEKLLL